MYTYTAIQLQQKTFGELKLIAREFGIFPVTDRRCRQNWIDAIVGVNPPLLQLLEFSPAASVEQVQPIIETVETPSAVEVEPVQTPPIQSKFGRIVYLQPVQKSIAQVAQNSPGVDVDRAQEAIVEAAEISPGVSRSKVSIAHQFLELFQSRAHIIEDSPGVKTEATVSESAIAPAAKNPILTGVTFSDRFLARYSPPQALIIHFQSDADGQLSLLNFEIESLDEPPDPDDFEFLDAFREALARWDCEHNEVSPEHNEVNAEHNEPLQVSLDSFCLWAHCPHTWYEPSGWHPSEVMELLRVGDSSDTSNFFIPTFCPLGNPTNRRNSDEFSTAGVGARLPKPSLPSFPPMTACQPQLKRIPNAAQTQSKRIPNPY
jgi:hypothetical protein